MILEEADDAPVLPRRVKLVLQAVLERHGAPRRLRFVPVGGGFRRRHRARRFPVRCRSGLCRNEEQTQANE